MKHRILIVDNKQKIKKSIEQMLHNEEIKFTCCDSAKKAVSLIKSSEQPFSLILSDQEMPEINGTDLLELARKITPNTIRFLVTGYSQMDVLINAVNRGAVHRFISKPLNTEDIIDNIKNGLKHYKTLIESEHLLSIARNQNSQLYKLSSKLKQKTKHHDKILKELDKEAMRIEKEIKVHVSTQKPATQDELIATIEETITASQTISVKNITGLLFLPY